MYVVQNVTLLFELHHNAKKSEVFTHTNKTLFPPHG